MIHAFSCCDVYLVHVVFADAVSVQVRTICSGEGPAHFVICNAAVPDILWLRKKNDVSSCRGNIAGLVARGPRELSERRGEVPGEDRLSILSFGSYLRSTVGSK